MKHEKPNWDEFRMDPWGSIYPDLKGTNLASVIAEIPTKPADQDSEKEDGK